MSALFWFASIDPINLTLPAPALIQIFDKQKREKREEEEEGESNPLITTTGEDVEMVSRKDKRVLRRPRGHTASTERMELHQDEEKG